MIVVNIRNITWDTDNQNLLKRLPQEMKHELLHGADIYDWGDDKDSITEEIYEYLAENYHKAKGFVFGIFYIK